MMPNTFTQRGVPVGSRRSGRVASLTGSTSPDSSSYSGRWLVRSALRHPSARLGAATAGIRTLLHHLVIPHAAARLFARTADLRAYRACPRVERRSAQHEASARTADLGAVVQQSNVIGFSVLPADLETLLHRLDADRVAAQTFVDALLHLLADRVFCGEHSPSYGLTSIATLGCSGRAIRSTTCAILPAIKRVAPWRQRRRRGRVLTYPIG